MSSEKRPLVFNGTVAVMDDATLQLLFAHRLVSAAYSKRPPATNSRKRKILTVRRQRPDLRVLLPAEEEEEEEEGRVGGKHGDGKGADAATSGVHTDGEAGDAFTNEGAASKRVKVAEAPRSWADTGAPDVRTVIHEATGNVEDRRTKSDLYESVVCLPLRLTTEEAYCAVKNRLVRLVKMQDSLWVARTIKKGEGAGDEDEVEDGKEVDVFAGCVIGASAFELRSCLVFEDMWNKGWIITKGTNFGAEFLIYTSDPGTTHSIFMISVTDGEREHEFAPTVKWTALAALATKVRKRMLLATVTASQHVHYTLVEGCMFRRTDFLKGKAMENEALQKEEPQYVEPAAPPTVRELCENSAANNEHDELGVESSIAV